MSAVAHALPDREAPADGPTRTDRVRETARRVARAQVLLGRLSHLVAKASILTGTTKDFDDGWQFREGEDFTIPAHADYDPATDAFDRTWLVPEQQRLVAILEATAARVEFLDRTPRGQKRIITLRVHLL